MMTDKPEAEPGEIAPALPPGMTADGEAICNCLRDIAWQIGELREKISRVTLALPLRNG